MTCEHLSELESELVGMGIPLTFRGQAWTANCREWVYFDCYLDLAAIRNRLNFAECIQDHTNDDPKSGTERGFVCQQHHDGVMGLFEQRPAKPVVK